MNDIPRKLLRWFDRHRRDLPWRRTRDPYAIWVSEVMLQQTQAATVVGYFERFLAAFPTVQALAAVCEEEVLRLWEGLGYYRRARHLHQAARVIVAEHDGRFPQDPEMLRRLPGLGRYSVGAILSQAFDLRLPIVEANSRRVLCRLFGYRGDPRRGPGARWLWRIAEEVLPRRRVGDFNQALMELGALVCTPAPHCDSCPLTRSCMARQRGIQDRIPPRPAPSKVVEIHEVGVAVQRREHVLLVQRPATAQRWPGLWEFPHDVAASESRDSAETMVRKLTGLTVRIEDDLPTIRHTVTRHQIRMVCFLARYRAGSFRSSFYQQGRWVELHQLPRFAVSAPQRRLMETVMAAATAG